MLKPGPRTNCRRAVCRAATRLGLLTVAVATLVSMGSVASAAARPTAGAVIASEDITAQPNSRIVNARRVVAMTYLSEGPHGNLVPVRGSVSIPARPAGGWRLVAFGHGTTGLGDKCTTTDRMGSKVGGKGVFDDWFGQWLGSGYVFATTEYAGIGGPGVHAYSDGKVAGKNLLDAARAARAIVKKYTGGDVGKGFVTVGGSQGGQTSLWAGRQAPSYAPELKNVGTVAQSVPTEIASMLSVIRPGIPPVPVPDYVTYVSYILAGVKVVRPDVDVDSYLTPLGRRVVEDAKTLCYPNQGRATKGLGVGQLVSRPLAQGNLIDAIRQITSVPNSGYREPILIYQGLYDPVVPMPFTDDFVEILRRNNAVPVDYRKVPTSHGLESSVETQALRWANSLRWPAR
ncbi:lipase family protein [Gordonia sp. CPCC 205333]|uniref:lipase family protein n=1 Tax=Gordonia sp. CPCC 205333 TaxID=3140790 RepID=UPI003AF34C75